MIWSALGAAVAAFLAAEAATAQSFCRYEITAIIQGPPCGVFPGFSDVAILAVNDHEQVAGVYEDCFAGSDNQPFIWTKQTGIMALPLPPGMNFCESVDINNVLGHDGIGQVVCTLQGPRMVARGFRFDDGTWTELPAYGSPENTQIAINDLQQVSGTRPTAQGPRGYRWENGDVVSISLNGSDSRARAINARGDVAGELVPETIIPTTGMWWDGTGVVDLGPIFPGSTLVHASRITTNRVIAGTVWFTSPRGRCFRRQEPSASSTGVYSISKRLRGTRFRASSP